MKRRDHSAREFPAPPPPIEVPFVRLAKEQQKAAIEPLVVINVQQNHFAAAIAAAEHSYSMVNDPLVKALQYDVEAELHTMPCAQTWFTNVVISAVYANRMRRVALSNREALITGKVRRGGTVLLTAKASVEQMEEAVLTEVEHFADGVRSLGQDAPNADAQMRMIKRFALNLSRAAQFAIDARAQRERDAKL